MIIADDYQKRAASCAPKKRKSRPASMSSLDSLLASPTPGTPYGVERCENSGGIAIHQRSLSSWTLSSATSQTPILDHQAAAAHLLQNPFDDLLPIGARSCDGELVGKARLPMTTNVLSSNSRRHLVRQSRKLEQILGSVVTKDAVSTVYRPAAPSRPLRLMRSRSFPPHSLSTSVASFEKVSEAGDIKFRPARRSNLSPPTPSPRSESPPASSPVDEWFPRTIPTAVSFAALGDTLEAQRRERQRRLAKLQRMLGERVPVELALSDSPGRSASELTTPIGGLSGRIKGALRIGKRSDTSCGTRHQDRPDIDVIASPNFATITTNRAPVSDMTRARKLENIFGDVPPRGMCSSSIASDMPVGRARSLSVRTIDTYRSSIASLRLLAVSDPESLDFIVDSYASEPPDTVDSDRQPHTREEQPAPVKLSESFRLRTESMTAHAGPSRFTASTSNRDSLLQTSKRATKIAQLLGTTRGQVWQALLDDLDFAVREDQELEPEEQLEILQSVAKLRKETVQRERTAA
ncbi:hypothetical protein OIV83_006442 [Microbotryomycetes sp. JL201]|nr:hypothetical protein OIV83_006442 [Microbotryomycetes sp. JL201]